MKNYIKLGLIVVLGIIVFLLLNVNNAIPGSPLFAVKRLEEKVFLKLKSSPEDKISYQSFLLETRLKELAELANQKKYSYILEASLRYSATAGNLTELIVQNSQEDQAAQTIRQFEQHKTKLQNIYISYPMEDTEGKYLLDDKNYLDLYIEKLKQLS